MSFYCFLILILNSDSTQCLTEYNDNVCESAGSDMIDNVQKVECTG